MSFEGMKLSEYPAGKSDSRKANVVSTVQSCPITSFGASGSCAVSFGTIDPMKPSATGAVMSVWTETSRDTAAYGLALAGA